MAEESETKVGVQRTLLNGIIGVKRYVNNNKKKESTKYLDINLYHAYN